MTFETVTTPAPQSRTQVESEPVTLRVRCPNCYKLYLVSPQEILEPRPRFECTQCQTRFWLQFPECLEQPEIIGFPLSWLQLEKKTSASAVNRNSDDSNLNQASKVQQMWAQVLADYENQALHREFVTTCQNMQRLDFATKQYQKILAAMASDEIAQRMLKEIIALGLVGVENEAHGGASAVAGWPQTRPVLRAARKLRRQLNWSYMLMSAGLIMMAAGYLWPIVRNLVGVGAAVIFFTLAFRSYFASPKK